MSQPNNENKQLEQKPFPKEAQGLCWGGFFLSWIWAIGNRTWIGLLFFVPIIGIAIPFVLLFYGREWAWKNKNWNSVEQFNASQRLWSIFGFAFCLLIPIAGILAAIAIPNFQRYKMKSMQSEAKIRLLSVYTAEQIEFTEKGSFTSDLTTLNLDTSSTQHYRIGFAANGAEFAQICPDCTVTKTAFKAVAIGRIGAQGKLDAWTIDQNKVLVNVTGAF